jgi:putative mycofactocin binding protein MftB
MMRLAKHVKFRQEKFGGVLFETRSEKVFTLNATAAAVVREIEAGHEQSEIAANLTDRFSGSPATIEREVAGLIGDLRQKGLLEDSARG